MKIQKSILLTSLALASTSVLAGPQTYSLIDLGTISNVSPESWGYAVNDYGQVTGVVGNLDERFPNHAFLWSNWSIQDLNQPGMGNSWGYGINISGQVTGQAKFDINQANTNHAFLYVGGLMQDLGTLGGSTSWAGSVNAFGQVAGSSQISGDTVKHAFYFSGGVMHDIGALSLHNNNSGATGINYTGQVVGEFDDLDLGTRHAFLFSGGVISDLGVLYSAPWAYSSANAINDRGQVVGGSMTRESDGHGWYEAAVHAFLYSNAGPMQDLGTLSPDLRGWSSAYGINNSGQIVGFSETEPSNSASHAAFLWMGGKMYNLNNLVDNTGAGWTLTIALGISNSGYITGFGTKAGVRHAFLLRPRTLRIPGGQSG